MTPAETKAQRRAEVARAIRMSEADGAAVKLVNMSVIEIYRYARQSGETRPITDIARDYDHHAVTCLAPTGETAWTVLVQRYGYR